MRPLLNTLYITQQDVYIGRDGLNIVIWKDQEKLGQFPIHYFENIICFNYTGMSPEAMALCLENEVGVSFLTPQGKMLGRLAGKVTGNVLLRQEQFRIADDKKRSLQFAKQFITGKLYNSLQVVNRAIRDYKGQDFVETLQKTKKFLQEAREDVNCADSLEKLLGIEGDFSRNYFQVFDLLILQQKYDFSFNVRTRRPPRDPVNTMLSLTYGMIRVLVENALTTVGLDPYVGFFHQPRPGRSSLALDLMEELRAYMGDRFVLTLINLRQININDFLSKQEVKCYFRKRD